MDEATAQSYADEVVAGWNRGDAVLIIGGPGVGKTMIARRAWERLPMLPPAAEAVVEQIYRSSRLPYADPTEAPFRAPHHSISIAGMWGTYRRGTWHPGEVSLASEGVLYLDEFTEFPRAITSELGRVFENQSVQLSVGGSSWRTFPAKFKLIAGVGPRYIVPDIFSTVIDLGLPPARTGARASTPTSPRPTGPETEGERLKKFFFPPPAAFKTRGSGGFFGLPSWNRRRR